MANEKTECTTRYVRLDGCAVWEHCATWGVSAVGPSTECNRRDRSNLPSNIKKIEYVAVEELAAAIEMVVRPSHGIESDEAIKETARLLGFQRVTDSIEARIERVSSDMINDGQLMLRNGQLVVRN